MSEIDDLRREINLLKAANQKFACDLEYAQAVNDGGEEFLKESFVNVFGLLACTLARNNIVKFEDIMKDLSESLNPDPKCRDHVDEMIKYAHDIVDFHRRLTAGELEPHVSLAQRLALPDGAVGPSPTRA